MTERAAELIARLAELFAGLPPVEAVALGGSRAGGHSDPASDIDLFVYTRGPVPLAEREAIVAQTGGTSRADLGLTFWGPGDEWLDAASGIEVDIVYFEAEWMEAQLRRVIDAHQPSLGYSTCFWHTVRHSQMLYDRQGWYAALQEYSQQAYPEALRRNIVAYNHAVLREVIPAYTHQLEKAVQRGDRVSANHRLAALLASYFDILFALNRKLHPGEKRLVALAQAGCEKLPENMEADLQAALNAAGGKLEALMPAVATLLDRLDALLEQEGFRPSGWQPGG